MATNYDYQIGWIRRTKERLVKFFGGKCESCGYNKTTRALKFHHVNASKKEFNLSGWKTKNWDAIANEAKKCVMVCGNCHDEIHDGLRKCPELKERNFKYDKFGILKSPREIRKCRCCNEDFQTKITSNQRYCSLKCVGRKSRSIGWPTIDELQKMINVNGYRGTGRLLGVTDNAVKKHYLKYR